MAKVNKVINAIHSFMEMAYMPISLALIAINLASIALCCFTQFSAVWLFVGIGISVLCAPLYIGYIVGESR